MIHLQQDSLNAVDPISGLRANETEIIRRTLAGHAEIERTILFGSRARGTAKPGSDVDLTLMGGITLNTLSSLKRELEEGTNLPYFFDIIAYDSITNADLKKEIDERGVVFFER